MLGWPARALGLGCCWILAAIHFYVSAGHYPDQTHPFRAHWLGDLMAAAAFALTILGFVILTREPRFRSARQLAWAGSALVAALLFIGFMVSRTVGLPGFHSTQWPALAVASLVLEVVLIALCLAGFRRGVRSAPYPPDIARAADERRGIELDHYAP